MFTRRSPRRLPAWLMVGLLLLAQWLAAGHSIEHGRGAGSGPPTATAALAHLAQPGSGDVEPAAPAGTDADALCLKCLLLSQLASVATSSVPPAAGGPLPLAWDVPADTSVGSRTPVLARARGPPELLS